MSNILVPSDFSDNAMEALQFAAKVAKKAKLGIDVLHAYSLPATGAAVMVDITEVIEKNALAEMNNFKESIEKRAEFQDVQINFFTRHGRLVDAINKFAHKHASSFVIMGTKGAGNIADKLLGSNTSATAREVKLPVFAIPKNCDCKSFDKVVIATDLKDVHSDTTYHFLKNLRAWFDSKLNFIHVARKEVDIESKKRFELNIENVFGANAILQIVENSDVGAGILETVKRQNADLLVVFKQEYGFLEGLFHDSVSKKLVNQASLPILVLKQ